MRGLFIILIVEMFEEDVSWFIKEDEGIFDEFGRRILFLVCFFWMDILSLNMVRIGVIDLKKVRGFIYLRLLKLLV